MHHNGLRGVARYLCNDATINHGRRTKCIAFGNMRIDAAVSAEVLSVLAPLGLDAALQAIADHERVGAERLRQIEFALEHARYEATRLRMAALTLSARRSARTSSIKVGEPANPQMAWISRTA